MNDDFMEQLTVAGFNVCIHGHIHSADRGFYDYDKKRGIHIISAGTFGAKSEDRAEDVPLQYNLLKYDEETCSITVETRKKDKPNGAWKPDKRWGENKDQSSYVIRLIQTEIEFSDAKLQDLINALLECQVMFNPQSREIVKQRLRPEIRNSIQRSDRADLDVNNIVTGCRKYPQGLSEFISIVRDFEKNSFGMLSWFSVNRTKPIHN